MASVFEGNMRLRRLCLGSVENRLFFSAEDELVVEVSTSSEDTPQFQGSYAISAESIDTIRKPNNQLTDDLLPQGVDVLVSHREKISLWAAKIKWCGC